MTNITEEIAEPAEPAEAGGPAATPRSMSGNVKRRSSTASRLSAGASPGCSTRSSPRPTVRAARRRPRCWTRCSCPPSPTPARRLQTDAAVVMLPSGERLAFSTDSFVVKPWRFPGGSIGDLAVNGTVNDLAMMGARPIALSAAFVLEEGFADRVAARDRRRHGRGGVEGRGFDRHR